MAASAKNPFRTFLQPASSIPTRTKSTLATRAAAIALELDHPVYDCFYLALSEAQNAPLVSADRRLIFKTEGTPFAQRTVHLSAAAPRR